MAGGHPHGLVSGQSAASVMLCELAQRGPSPGRGAVAVQLFSCV